MFNLAKYFDNIVALMNTLKLFLKGLLNNNACVEGGRKKPWYLAVIMFFLSIAAALVPVMTLSLKQKAHNEFDSTTYGSREAFTAFAEELNKPEYAESMYVIKGEEKKDRLLDGGKFHEYQHQNDTLGHVDFIFVYDKEYDANKYASLISRNVSVVYFTETTVRMSIVNQVNGDSEISKTCGKAYKYFDAGYKLSSNYKVNADNLTKTINDSWDSWLNSIDKFYNATRLHATWTNVGLFAAIDAAIALIMALMIFLLTRGKKNPYRTVVKWWQAFTITSWTMVTPAILSLALGFLIKNFATALFPLTLGVRAMWLSMKSFRPDGTGYQD